ncbi:MAG: ATP-binding protein [Lachnospiraceae bacterium]|jgi:signal transduction histidine kinase/CheY-like chemotaxis protein|nr:ATP-binding protein [Lachnospiraceae bacterium]
MEEKHQQHTEVPAYSKKTVQLNEGFLKPLHEKEQIMLTADICMIKIRCDEDMTVIEGKSRLSQFTGYTQKEFDRISGGSLRGFLTGYGLVYDKLQQAIQKIDETEESIQKIFQLPAASGMLWVKCIITADPHAEDTVRVVSCVLIDVTDVVEQHEKMSKAKEAAEIAASLKWENERLGRIINNVPAGICVCLVKDGIPHEVTINRHMAHRLGMSEQAPLLCTFDNLIACIHPEDQSRNRTDFETFLVHNKPLDAIYRIKVQGTEDYAWAHVEGNLILSLDGMGVAYLAYTDITELASAASKLQESRKLYENAVKSARLVLWEYDVANHRITFADNELTRKNCEKYGFPQTVENIPDSLAEYFEASEIPKVRAMYQSVEAGREVSCEMWYKAQTGREPCCIRTTYTIVKNKAGSPVKAYGIGQNITEDKKAQERYEHEMEYLHQNSDQHLIFKARCNLTGNVILDYTPLSECAYPIQANDSYDSTWTKFTKLVRTDSGKKALRGFIERGNLIRSYQHGDLNHQIQYCRRSTKISSIWVRLIINTYKSPDTGNIECFMYAYDITEKILVQEIIAKLTDLDYDELGLIDMESGTLRVYRLDKKHDGPIFSGVVDYNTGMRERLSAFPPEKRGAMERAMSLTRIVDALKSQSIYIFSSPIVNSDGAVRQKLFQMTWLNQSHEVVFFCMSDITRQYEAEHRRITELEAAKLAADRANEAKSSFLSSMSHDLRTPLNGILGFTDIAIRENDPIKKQGYLQKIQSSGKLLLALVNDTLEMSRIESGKFVLENAPVDSRELGLSVVTALRPSAELKNLRLEANDLPQETLLTDKLKLQKILLNLLSNSIKYTSPGGTISLSVEVLTQSIYGCDHRITVKDNGIGMSEEFLTRLFEPFSQEHRPESANIAGTGLGLSIVKRIVDLMGGRIEVQSKMHVGTKFTIYLPLPRANEIEKQISTQRFPEVSLKGRKILLCEDNRLNTEIAVILLKEQGIAVDCAVDGTDGVTAFRESMIGYYDAILMDLRMPNLDGCGATEKIRALPRQDAKTVPIIAMSADAFEEDIQKAHDAGMNDYLTKPIEQKQLIAVLQKALGR